jgi:hypothetical protein
VCAFKSPVAIGSRAAAVRTPESGGSCNNVLEAGRSASLGRRGRRGQVVNLVHGVGWWPLLVDAADIGEGLALIDVVHIIVVVRFTVVFSLHGHSAQEKGREIQRGRPRAEYRPTSGLWVE